MGIDLDLSRRAVAAGWKWQAGALDETGYRAISEVGDGLWQLGRRDCMGNLSARPMLPDFRDPATRGCLLQLVREAWGKQVYAVPLVDAVGITRWIAYVPDPAAGLFDWQQFDGPSEAEALVAALEAAGRR